MNLSRDSVTSTQRSQTERAQGIEDIYPLSPLQEGLLFHALYAPESPAYFMQAIWTLSGELQVTAFRAAWQQLVDRHQVLRTFFMWERRDQPLQVVLRHVVLPWEELDWSDLPANERHDRLEAFLAADQRRGFDLTRAPLMRVELIRFGEHDYRLIWSHHHLLMDGWCAPILMRDLFTSYEALCQGQRPQLARPRPYREYIAWLQHQDFSAAEAFWRQELAGFTSPTQLGVDLAPGQLPSQNPKYVEHRRHLPAATTTALVTLARRHQITLNTVVQGAWALLLSRYSGERDVVFGITVSGRPAELEGAESIVGLFINTLALRLRPELSEQLFPWLQQVQMRQARMREYEHTPLVQVQNWSDVPRGTPLIETLLVFQNFVEDSSVWEGHQGVQITDNTGLERTSFPLTLIAIPGSRLSLRLVADSARFDDPATGRILAHLCNLLTSIADRSQQHLGELSMLDANEWQELVVTRNLTAAPYPTEMCYHQLVEAQIARTPDAIALISAGQQLSYRVLDAQANQLAHHLRALGVGPEVLVAICMERGPELLIGLLGIMKAGGAFLPLDPAFPIERMAFMIQDGQARVLLTQARLCERLPQGQVDTLCLDRDWATIARYPAESPPPSGVVAANLAYLIYTSGSTGRPKGVLVPHCGLVNYLFWCADAYGAASGRGAPVQSSIAADAIFPSLFAPLMVGTAVLLLPEEGALEALAAAFPVHAPFSLVKITPTQVEVLNQYLPHVDANNWVRTLVVGAEALRGDILTFWQIYAPRITLLNEYGPTETVVGCSIYQVPAGTSSVGAVPIGLPIANTQFYVLDTALQPVPVGLPGELYIGGDGVVWGYLNRPQQTAAAFIPDPFSLLPGARMYKTGDMVRSLPDRAANIEFIGRQDDQVKIRGYRVELGEVEAALAEHSAVSDVVVLARDHHIGQKQLVAYVVFHTGDRDKDTADELFLELRAFLQERLPGYMVPSAFVRLAVLPLMATGKLDRKALPAPTHDRSQAGAAYVAPRTATEQQLVNIWSGVLGIAQIGIYDNFFVLGGDSLLSLRMIGRAKQAGIQIAPRQVFEYPTIAALASIVDPAEISGPNGAAKQPPARMGTGSPRSTESGMLNGHHDAQPAGEQPDDQAIGALPPTPQLNWVDHPIVTLTHRIELPPDIGYAEASHFMRHIFGHHDVLRMRMHKVDNQRTFYIPPLDDTFVLYHLDLTGEPAWRRDDLIHSKIEQAKAELAQLTQEYSRFIYVTKGGGAPNLLLILLDHVNYDGYGIGPLIDDINLCVSQISQGLPIQLPPKTASYREWNLKLHEYLRSEAAAAHLDYWRRVPWESACRIPTDDPRAYFDDSLFSRKTVVALDEEATQALLDRARDMYQAGITDVLLSTLLLSLRASFALAEKAVSITTFVNRRFGLLDDIDTSRTLGIFVGTCTLVLPAHRTNHPVEVLRAVQNQVKFVPLEGKTQGWFLLRGEEKFQIVRSGITLNYVGRIVEDTGESRAAELELSNIEAGTDRAPSDEDYFQGMIRWPEYNFDHLESGATYLLRLHFVELLLTEPGERFFDIWVNHKPAIIKFDILRRVGARYTALVQELVCSADDSGRIILNLVSYRNSPGKATISGIELLKAGPATPLIEPYDYSLLQRVVQINAGGAAVGTFQADHCPSHSESYQTEHPIELGGLMFPAPPAVYQSASQCSFQDPTDWWPRLELVGEIRKNRLVLRVLSYDNLHRRETIHGLCRNLLDNLRALI